MSSRILAGLILAAFLPFSSIRAGTPPPASEIVKDKFHLDQAGEDQVGYAQAIRVGSIIYISGSVGDGPDLRTQLRRAYESIEKSLAKYGATFQNVVKENIFTTDLEEMIKQKDVRSEFYQGDWPAASWVGVQRLYVPALLVQVEVIAELPRDRK
jgi:enamine deaminase RidA (YjgF/YER057c/UK114 family)